MLYVNLTNKNSRPVSGFFQVDRVAEVFPVERPCLYEESVLLEPQCPVDDDRLSLLTLGGGQGGVGEAQVVGEGGGRDQEVGPGDKSRSLQYTTRMYSTHFSNFVTVTLTWIKVVG